MARISTFDDWTDYFRQWQRDIGLDTSKFGDYKFEVKFGPVASDVIEFGDYKGRPKWETVLQIPDQRVRDTLLHLITYQGDTEFASVEQQRNLLNTAPTEYDLQSAAKIMREEMRHGTQMSYLLVKYFGSSGKLEAQKLLERRAFNDTRLLGAFNQTVNDWLDFYCYTELVDRDGKYQLTMLSHSGFKPLAASMKPMLQEEFFHLLTGHTGLSRVIKAGKVPIEIIQRHLNKWFSVALDLFGVDASTSASWFYVWGLKGRYDEGASEVPADRDKLNELARQHYLKEVTELIAGLNKFIPESQPHLTLPDTKFHRSIGEYEGKTYSVRGELLTPEAYAAHLEDALPTDRDKVRLTDIFKEPDWVLRSEELMADTYVLVCQNADCKARGAGAILEEMTERLKESGVEVKSYMCFGACQSGPNVVVYPNKVWYSGVKQEDVSEIASHARGTGEPVERLTHGVEDGLKDLIYQLLDAGLF